MSLKSESVSSDDLRTIANGLFPSGLDAKSLTPEGRDEVREAVDVILELWDRNQTRLGLALEQLDQAANEIDTIRAPAQREPDDQSLSNIEADHALRVPAQSELSADHIGGVNDMILGRPWIATGPCVCSTENGKLDRILFVVKAPMGTRDVPTDYELSDYAHQIVRAVNGALPPHDSAAERRLRNAGAELYAAFCSTSLATPYQKEALADYAKASNAYPWPSPEQDVSSILSQEEKGPDLEALAKAVDGLSVSDRAWLNTRLGELCDVRAKR